MTGGFAYFAMSTLNPYWRDSVSSTAQKLFASSRPNSSASIAVTRREVVSQWRKRFFEERLAGLEERARPGRPRVFPPRAHR